MKSIYEPKRKEIFYLLIITLRALFNNFFAEKLDENLIFDLLLKFQKEKLYSVQFKLSALALILSPLDTFPSMLISVYLQKIFQKS